MIPAISNGPNWVESFLLYLMVETDPVPETPCFVETQDDDQRKK
jgi:hypothetical protein